MYHRYTESVTHVDNDYSKMLLGVFVCERSLAENWRHIKAHYLGITVWRELIVNDF